MVVSQHTSPKTLSPTSDGCWPSQAPVTPAPPLATGTAHLPIARTNPATTKPHHARKHPPAPRARTPAKRQRLREEPPRLTPSAPGQQTLHEAKNAHPTAQPAGKNKRPARQAKRNHCIVRPPSPIILTSPRPVVPAMRTPASCAPRPSSPRTTYPLTNATPKKDIASTPSQAPCIAARPPSPITLTSPRPVMLACVPLLRALRYSRGCSTRLGLVTPP